MSLACHLHAICICTCVLSICTHMPFVCHSYVLVYHPYVTCMYSYVILMLLVTRMFSYVICISFVCHSYALVCHLNVTRMYSYVLVYHPYDTHMYSYGIHMSLMCGSFHVKWTKISKVGTWPISDSDEVFPDEGYMWDKIILEISAQIDNLFKSYLTSKLAW